MLIVFFILVDNLSLTSGNNLLGGTGKLQKQIVEFVMVEQLYNWCCGLCQTNKINCYYFCTLHLYPLFMKC